MSNNKIKMYSLLKIKIRQILDADYNLSLNEDEEKEYKIKLPNSPLFDQLNQVRGYDVEDRINEIIFVEAKRNKKQEEELRKLLREGFAYNGVRYVRFGKSPSQGKDGITTFIDKRYFDEMTERSQLGLKIDKCIISKYESYRSLIFSSCHLVDKINIKEGQEKKYPYIVIIDEYEKVIPNQKVRFVKEIPSTFKNKDSGEVKEYNKRVITEGNEDIKISPFDGFGVHTPEINEVLSDTIGEDNKSILFQIRLPFMKGVTVKFDFRRYLKEELNTYQIKDVFGKLHNVDDIDCIWNISMWKGYKYFKDEYGNEAWNVYLNRIGKYNYKLGISKFNHHMDDLQLYSRMNFQYLQCLDLINPKYVEKFKNKDRDYDILNENNHGKVINLAKYSTDFVENIIKGDKLSVLKYLGIHDTSDQDSVKSKYEQALLINDKMFRDISIKKMLNRKLNKTINTMKFGKIYVKGFYHTVIGDVIGYLEYSAGLEPKGCLDSYEFFAKTLSNGKCVSMRSPLVDPSEVNLVDLVENDVTKKWFNHFDNQDVVMINMYDLSMQQQGGMDMDGDSVFLTNNDIIINSKIDKPIVVDMQDKKGASPVPYDMDNIINYEINSRDSRIGEITNIATSILNQFTENKKWVKRNEDNVAILRLYQGKEIDFLKTGYRWHITKSLRNYLKKLPYFLLYNYPVKLNTYNKLKQLNKGLNIDDKVDYNAFHSPSPMNELCDYVCQWEKKNIKWDNKVENTGDLLVDRKIKMDNKLVFKSLKTIYNQFTNDLRNIVEDEDKVKDLYQKYEDKLNSVKVEYGLIKDEFINYCIKSAYSSISRDKTLCWYLFGDEMLENLRNNSEDTVEQKIIECSEDDQDAKEFLGRYYKLVNVGDMD